MPRWIASLVLLLLTGCAGSRPEAGAPPLAFQPVRGEALLDLGAFRGRVVLVNLWATWCAPCVAAMPALARLQEGHPADLAVVFLSDEPRALVRPSLAVRPFAGRFGTREAGRLAEPQAPD